MATTENTAFTHSDTASEHSSSQPGDRQSSSISSGVDEKLALATGGAALCFLIGFAIGSKRYDLVADSGRKLLAHVGTIAFDRITEALRSA